MSIQSAVAMDVPPAFARLVDLAYNLWWSWTPEARRMFSVIDPLLWATYRNPVQVLMSIEPQHWERLLKVIGRADLVDDPRFSTPEARREHVADVDALIADWMKHYTKHEAMEILGRAGVPAGAVLDTQEITDDPGMRAREMIVELNHSERGTFTMPGWPVKLSGSHVPVLPAPLLGADNEAVYGEWLGFDSAALVALKAGNVI